VIAWNTTGGGRVLRRRKAVDQDVQREEGEAEADRDAAEILDAGASPAAERQESDDEQDRRRGRHIEGENLNDQRRADVGAEHDGERGHQRDHAFRREGGGHQAGGGAALQERGEAETRAEGGKTVAQSFGEEGTEIGAEGAHDAALDHVQAPKQQCCAAHQVEKDDRAHRVSDSETI
jgi:hypothetical protein